MTDSLTTKGAFLILFSFFSLVNVLPRLEINGAAKIWKLHLHNFNVVLPNPSSTIEALVSDHLGNSEKWSQLELVAYENRLS